MQTRNHACFTARHDLLTGHKCAISSNGCTYIRGRSMANINCLFGAHRCAQRAAIAQVFVEDQPLIRQLKRRPWTCDSTGRALCNGASAVNAAVSVNRRQYTGRQNGLSFYRSRAHPRMRSMRFTSDRQTATNLAKCREYIAARFRQSHRLKSHCCP